MKRYLLYSTNSIEVIDIIFEFCLELLFAIFFAI